MTTKKTVDLGWISSVVSELSQINSMELKDIIIMDNGTHIPLSPAEIEEWEFIGLNNFTYLRDMVYDRGYT